MKKKKRGGRGTTCEMDSLEGVALVVMSDWQRQQVIGSGCLE